MSEPTASLPLMPGYKEMIDASGGKTLPWSWAVERLDACRNLHLTTVRPDGRPHVMPIWGIWRKGAFEFSTGQQSRKAKNIRKNHHVAVATDDGSECVIIEGAAGIMPASSHAAFIAAYAAKYDWEMTDEMAPFYVVTPTVVFGIREYGDKDTGGVTRWAFG
jgi:nitroimidazol reductase NimA-like FMN-containing flavoprotein (pyridoxamine 5'-phosphate oxidase superfamily)